MGNFYSYLVRRSQFHHRIEFAFELDFEFDFDSKLGCPMFVPPAFS